MEVPATGAVPDAMTETEADGTVDANTEAVIVFELPGRLGMIGITEAVVVALRMLEMTVLPVAWATPEVVLKTWVFVPL